MIYIQLFLGFLYVGCFSFGGAYSAIPLIRDAVLAYGWLTEDMLAYIIAVSESTPGPIMVNLATYVGFSQAGIPGAILATVAVVLPAFLIVLALTAALSKVAGNKYIQAIFNGIFPCIIGIIFATGGWMIIKNLFSVPFSSFDIVAVVITLILAVVYFGFGKKGKKKISPVGLIAISALLGMVGYAL